MGKHHKWREKILELKEFFVAQPRNTPVFVYSFRVPLCPKKLLSRSLLPLALSSLPLYLSLSSC
jgi:hypothetical protein